MKLYKIRISEIEKTSFEKWFSEMTEERKAEVLRLKAAEKQAQKIAAHHLCRSSISEFCGIPETDIILARTEYGKPYAEGLPVHFSVSHSGDYAVCAVSENEIGIDIEKIRKINPNLSTRFASENETEYISSHENGLFEIWTLKEAYFKCIGTGLGPDIKSVSFSIQPSGIICSESGFECSFAEIGQEYICSVCEKTNK